MMHPKIYQGEKEILDKLSESYCNSFQAKMYYSKETDEFSSYKIQEYWWYFDEPGKQTNGYKRIRLWISDEKYREQIQKLPDQRWYIISIYNIHHQQFLNPHILYVNFDCLEKKLLFPWRYDQTYPGYPYHLFGEYAGDIRTYDENGAPGV